MKAFPVRSTAKSAFKQRQILPLLPPAAFEHAEFELGKPRDLEPEGLVTSEEATALIAKAKPSGASGGSNSQRLFPA